MCNSECITDLAFNMYCDCYIGPIVTWYTSVVIFIYVVMCLMSSSALDDFYSHGDSSPYFIPQPNTVTFNAGQTATLQCSVENLGDKSITWKKSSEPNHISIDDLIFDPDKRFNVSISRERREYDLKIFNVQPKDAGVYICQVSSTQLLIRHVRLIVLGKKTLLPQSELTNENQLDTTSSQVMPEILLTGRQFVYSGEAIRLVCNVTGIADVPNDLVWYKDGYMLRPSHDKKISIQTDSSVRKRKLNSVLEIKHSKREDAGTYLCFKSKILLASQKIIVLQAVKTNPDKRGTAGHATSGQICNKQWWTLFMTILLYTCITNVVLHDR